jgi:coenzyme F420 hydrogenase subunit delta
MPKDVSSVPEYCRNRVVVLGCGNTLLGDDGLGPAVIEYLHDHCRIPADVSIIDAGTAVREILFDIILSEIKPQKIIVIDALDCNRTAGEIFSVSIEEIPKRNIHDFSVHQMPTLNMLKELRDLCHVEVIVLAAQPENIPENAKPGLSHKMQEAVVKISDHIIKTYI